MKKDFQKSEREAVAQAAKDTWTVAQAALYLRVTQRTVHHLIARGVLTPLKVPTLRKVYFRADEVIGLMQEEIT